MYDDGAAGGWARSLPTLGRVEPAVLLELDEGRPTAEEEGRANAAGRCSSDSSGFAKSIGRGARAGMGEGGKGRRFRRGGASWAGTQPAARFSRRRAPPSTSTNPTFVPSLRRQQHPDSSSAVSATSSASAAHLPSPRPREPALSPARAVRGARRLRPPPVAPSSSSAPSSTRRSSSAPAPSVKPTRAAPSPRLHHVRPRSCRSRAF